MVIPFRSTNQKKVTQSNRRMIQPQPLHDDEGTYGDKPVVFPEGPEGGSKPTRYYVDDVEVTVATERVQYLDAEGKLITESLKDYTRKTVKKSFDSLDAFLTKWNETDRKQAILDELAAKGVFLRRAVGAGREQLRRFRSHLSHSLRPAATDPTRTRRTTLRNEMFSQNMARKRGPF